MSQRLERKQRFQTRRSFLKLTILIFAVAVAGSLVYVAGRNIMTAYQDQQRKTILAQYGTIEDKLQGSGLVLRSETVFKAPAEGFFENIKSDGSKVSLNTLLGYYLIRGEKTPLRSSTSGLFTRQLDGLEEVLRPLTLSTVGPEIFGYRSQHHAPESEFKSGQGVYKIVDNLEPTRLILQFPAQNEKLELKKEQRASLSVDGRLLGECKVIDFKHDFSKLLIMVETIDFREELLHTRQVNAALTLHSHSGYLIPEKSLLKKGQEKGIYCIKGEEILFRPVQVLNVKDGTAVVEGLQPNDMVILKPDKVRL